MAITCPPGTFSIQTLLLYFCHLHSLLFVLLFIILSLTWRISISGGRSVRGKITCFSFGKIFSILRPHSSNLFYWFRLRFCALFVLWLDQFLDIFVITLHTQRNNKMATPSMTIKLARFQHGDGVFHIKALAFACPKMRSLGSRVFDSTRIVPDSTAAPWAFAHQMAHHGFLLYSPGLLPTSTGVVLQTFIQDTLLDWMEGGNATPATIILWTIGLQKVHLCRPPEQHPSVVVFP